MLAAKVVVEDPTVGGFVNMRQTEVHMVAFDGVSYATDEDDCAIRFLPLNDPDVRQRVVHLAISVVVPCIIEENQIAGVGVRSPVEPALLPDVCMNDPDAVGVRGDGLSVIEIDPVFEEHRTGHPCAIIGDVPAVAFNCGGAYELGSGPYDRTPARRSLDGWATEALCWYRCVRVFDRLRDAADERHNGDSGRDEEESHCFTAH